MSLSSNNLDAFVEVARQKNFSVAAKKLHITQSALSQRVLNLEQDIGSTLFIREPSGVRLTELGQRLLRYCQSKELLESEFMTSIRRSNSAQSKSLSGIIRMAAFSTITRSVVVPIVAGFIKEHSELQVEIRNAELRELPSILSSGGTDFIFLNQSLEKQGIENHLLGFEENVLVQSSAKSAREDIYLDHDEEDTTTHDFLKAQGRKVPVFKRSYLDEIYSIVDGVRHGMGRAVVPMHLVESVKGIEVVSGYKPLKIPIYLTYYSQTFYTDLQKYIIESLSKEFPKYLSLR